MSKRVNFTADRINRFTCEPGKHHTIHWDADTSGLGLRVTAKGARSFVFETRLHGKTLRTTIGSTKDWDIKQARTEARNLKVLTDQGIDPRKLKAEQKAQSVREAVEDKRRELLVGDAWGEYLKNPPKKNGKPWGAKHLADHLHLSQAGGEPKKRGKGLTVQGPLYPLLAMRMADVTAVVLKDWQAREAEARPTSARKAYELFRAFWRWCAARDEYAGLATLDVVESRTVRDEVPARNSKRFDVLERSQLPAWFAAVSKLNNPCISAYLQGLLLTGARREELAALRWADVDFQWKVIWLKDKVQAEGRKIPLTPYLATLLESLPRRNEWVFSSPASKKTGRIQEPRIPHNRALDAAGLPHVSLHGLRRTFATLAEWVEMPRGVVAQIMGHAPNATAERHYINRPLDLLAVWHEKYEAWILKEAKVPFKASKEAKRLKVIK